MKKYDTTKQIADFTDFLSRKKNEFQDQMFIHIKINSEFNQPVINDIVNTSERYYKNIDSAMLHFKNEVILTVSNRKGGNIQDYLKVLNENFPAGSLTINNSNLSEYGIQQFLKIITPHIPPDCTAGSIGLQRATRMANCIMVADDDPMILRQMEHALAGFGNVICVQNAADIIDVYKKYAPDILFMDVHMPAEKGTNILEKIISDYDPHAYIVMISSDTLKETIVESRTRGTSGYLMKPLTRQNIYAHIMHAPSFVQKRNA